MHLQSINAKPMTEAERALRKAFRERMERLYRLAYLITGDREQSSQALVAALKVYDTDVDIKKIVAAGALKMIEGQRRESILRFCESMENGPSVRMDAKSLPGPMIDPAQIEGALLAIDVFPRCAVLLTVLERFSDKDASFVLNVSERLVKSARAQGLIELTRNMASLTDEEPRIFADGVRLQRFCHKGR